jgi:adenylosuccinate synthase
VRTLLSRFVLIEPYALLNEAAHLAAVGVPDALDRLVIDRRCPVITPYHQAANRLRELARGAAAHGTCGMGVGEAASDLADDPSAGLFAGDLADRARVRTGLRRVRERKMAQLCGAIDAVRTIPAARREIDTLTDTSWIDAALDVYAHVAQRVTIASEARVSHVLHGDGTGTVVFEGAQGVLLDEWRGFHPYTTWSTTTFANADTVLDEAGFPGPRTRVGVVRSYATRHGPGPFPTERSELRPHLPEPHNGDAGRQGRFRVGAFDAVTTRYAIAAAGGVDVLAMTHADRIDHLPPYACTAYASGEGTDDGDDADDLFVREGKRRTDIRVGTPRDLIRQERLTAAMLRCQVLYEPVPADRDGFVEWIGRVAGCPAGIVSEGPTAFDKSVRATSRLARPRAVRVGAAVRRKPLPVAPSP